MNSFIKITKSNLISYNGEESLILFTVSTNNEKLFDGETLTIQYVFSYNLFTNMFSLVKRLNIKFKKHIVSKMELENLNKKLNIKIKPKVLFKSESELNSFLESELFLLVPEYFKLAFKHNI